MRRSERIIVSDRIAEPFLEADNTFLHGITFAGHPVSCAIALKNIEIFEDRAASSST